MTHPWARASLPELMNIKIIIILAALFFCGATQAPNPAALKPSQQATYLNVIRDEFCECSSALTIQGCLQLKPQCTIAKHLADFAFDQAQQNKNSDEILSFISQRIMGPYCKTPIASLLHLPAKGEIPSKGNVNANITVIEFADFRCTHCKQMAPIIAQTIKEFGKQVRFVFLPFPLRNDPRSVIAAEALITAEALGGQKAAWAMHDILFKQDDQNFTAQSMTTLAKKIGLNTKKFSAALKTHQYRDWVMKLKNIGEQAGIIGTPSFFINGRPARPDQQEWTLKQRLILELDRAQGTKQCQ